MTDHDDVRDLLAELRGGIPALCDFCGQAREQHELHHEEGGEWACIDCIRLWDAQESEGAKMRAQIEEQERLQRILKGKP